VLGFTNGVHPSFTQYASASGIRRFLQQSYCFLCCMQCKACMSAELLELCMSAAATDTASLLTECKHAIARSGGASSTYKRIFKTSMCCWCKAKLHRLQLLISSLPVMCRSTIRNLHAQAQICQSLHNQMLHTSWQ